MPLPPLIQSEFSLKEIRQRWKLESVGDLIKYCINGTLEIGAIINDFEEYLIINNLGESSCELNSYFMLSIKDIRSIYMGEELSDEQACVKALYRSQYSYIPSLSSEGLKVDDVFMLKVPFVFTLNDLVITAAERDRAEKEYNIEIDETVNETFSVERADKVTEDKPLDPREKKTLMLILKILCVDSKVILDKPYKAAEMILQMAATHNISCTLKKDTIAKYLKDIPED